MANSNLRLDSAAYWGPEAVHDYPESASIDPYHDGSVIPNRECHRERLAPVQHISRHKLLVELARFALACVGVALACGLLSIGVALVLTSNTHAFGVEGTPLMAAEADTATGEDPPHAPSGVWSRRSVADVRFHSRHQFAAFPGNLGAMSFILAEGTKRRREGGGMSSPHLLVHHHDDSVGVAVVENIETDMDVTVWVMDNDETLHFRTRDAIPLGHKMALVALNEGDTVYKYGHDIGRVVAPIQVGGHVHVHNVKTKRW